MNFAKRTKRSSNVVSAVLLIVFCWAGSAAAAQGMDTDEWQFDLTLYLWATDIGGTVNPDNSVLPGGDFDIDISDIIDNLNMTFMGGFEARKNKWSFIADTIYLGVGNDKDTTLPTKLGVPVNANVDLDIDTWILSGAVGYDVIHKDKGSLAIVGGLRYATMDVDVTLDLEGRPFDQSNSEDLLDGFVGVRGVINLNEDWYIPYYADIGTGDSDLTWQVLSGLGYRFSWGDIKLVYRYLGYNLEDDRFISDLNIYGPALGVVFRF